MNPHSQGRSRASARHRPSHRTPLERPGAQPTTQRRSSDPDVKLAEWDRSADPEHAERAATGCLQRSRRHVPDLEIVIPVHNEELALEDSLRRLHGYLSEAIPFSWRILIADNASTDATAQIARRLALALDRVGMMRIERKGRGAALRVAWSQSSARVVAYMDVDLSTDLKALLPLVAPLLCGHSEVAIGTRLAAGSRVTRGPKRELISRSYNHVLRTVLRAKFSDAQCGFKAVRADVLPELLGAVRDQGWFFDTELLVAAQRRGMRIHEVPVDWIDDPDSRVAILATAARDLRGVVRLMWPTHTASPSLSTQGN